VLKAVARQRLHANHDSIDIGDGRPEGEAWPITTTQSKRSVRFAHLTPPSVDRSILPGCCSRQPLRAAPS
jgi:hypothetical protein